MPDFKDLVKNLYTSKNRELTPEKLQYIEKKYSGNEGEFVKNFYTTIGEDLTQDKFNYISDTYLKKKNKLHLQTLDLAQSLSKSLAGSGGFVQKNKPGYISEEGEKPAEKTQPVTKELLTKNIKTVLDDIKKPTFQDYYNVGPEQLLLQRQEENRIKKEAEDKQKDLSSSVGTAEDENNYYYSGSAFPKNEYIKYKNVLVKKNIYSSPFDLNTYFAGFNELRDATIDWVNPKLSGGLQLLRDLPVVKEISESLYQNTGIDPLASAIKSMNDTIDDSDYILAKRGGLSDENPVKTILHAAPMIATIYATGGTGLAGAAGSAELAGASAANAEAIAGNVLYNASKRAVLNPLVKTLGITSGLESYGKARKAGESTSESVKAGISSAVSGAGSGLLLTAQGALAGRVTKDFMKSIYTAGLSPSTASSVSKVISALNTSLVFGNTSIVNDLIQGRVPDLDKAKHEAIIGFAFELPHFVKGSSDLVSEPYKKYKLDNSIFDQIVDASNMNNKGSKISITPKQVGELTNLTLENNAISNFFSAKPEAIEIANEVPVSHQQLFEKSIKAGEKAFNVKDINEKKALHVEQITLQKASDIKYVTEAILKNKDSFMDAIDKMDISPELKEAYKQRVNEVSDSYSESGRINKLFDTSIQSLNEDIKGLTNEANMAQSPSKKAEINAKISKKQAQLSELETALDKFAKSENERKENALNQTETKIKIDDFVDRINSGEDMSSPEDMQFYENNKKQIETKLRDAIQEQSTSSKVSPATEGGENIQEGGDGVGPSFKVEETPKEVGKEETIRTIRYNGLDYKFKGNRLMSTPDGNDLMPIDLMEKVLNEGKVVKEEISETKLKEKTNDKNKTFEETVSELESVNGKQKKIDLVDKLKSISTPEEFDIFLENNPKYKKYVSEKTFEAKVIEDTSSDVFNSSKEKAMSAISKFNEGLSEGKSLEKEKAKSLSDIVDGLREEIKIQLKEAKTGPLRSGKISATVARGIMNKINNAKTPMQILSAIDYVEKHLKDIDYGRKLSESKSIATSIKKISKDAPLNIRIALNTLAGSSPREISDVNDFLNTLSSASEFIKQKTPEGINQKQILDLASRIQKNNLQSRIDRAADILARKTADKDSLNKIESDRKNELNGVTSRKERKDINNKYNSLVNDVVLEAKSKLKKPISDSIEDMKNSLDELNDQIGVHSGLQDMGDTGTNKRETLEAINKSLKYDLYNTPADGLSDKKIDMVNALRDIDVDRLTDKQLKFLNYAINNFVENGSLDGVGSYIYNQYKIQKNFTPEVIKNLSSAALSMNKFKRMAFSRTAVDAFLNSAFASEHNVAVFRSVTGFGDWSNSYGSKIGFKGQLKKDMEYIRKVAEKTGVLNDPKSQIKLGATVDMIQHEKGLSPAEIQAEFEGRKGAMIESIRRGEDGLKTNVWAKDNADYVEMIKEVYDEYIKNANTPQDLINNLTSGEKKMMEAMSEKWDSIKEGQREISEIYKNEPFDELENYHARTYIPLYSAKIKSNDSGISNLLDSSSFRVRENLDKTKSTAFESRVLKGSQVRADHILNYNILDSFQNEYRKQLYDYHTYENRRYVHQAITSKEMLESLGGDMEMLNYTQLSFGNRHLNEINGLQSGKETGVGDEVWNLLRNSVVRDALGGLGTPFLKQFVPTISSVAVNSPETLWSSVWAMANDSKSFNDLISKSPVSLRHDQEIASTGGIVSAKDIKKARGLFKQFFKGLDKASDKLLMTSLKSGDQSSAGIAYLAYYQKSLLNQGKIRNLNQFDIAKEAKNPDKIAQQYAEQMTSTTLNINEAVNKPVDNTIPLLGRSLPFTSFAVNSKINLLNNIGKLAESGGVMSARERSMALQRIGSHIAESAAINGVGWMMRAISYGGAYSLFSAALSNSDMDDKLKAKSMDILENVFDNIIESNDSNSWNYFINDVLFGQIGENFSKPIAKDLYSAYNNFYSAASGNQPEKVIYGTADATAALAQTLGYKGILLTKGIKFMSDMSTGITYYNDPLFRLNKFGYINAYGNKVIPYEKQTTSVPAFNKYMQTMSVLSNTLSLFTGSPKEFQDFTRRIPKINSSIINGLYGKDKTIFSDNERYSRMQPVVSAGKKYYIQDDLSNISVADRDYVLDSDQLVERKKIKDQLLNNIYNNYMKKGVRGFSMVRSSLGDQLKKNPESSSLKKMYSELKYVGKYTNQQINNIADEISKYKLVNKYTSSDGKIKLKLKSEIEKK